VALGESNLKVNACFLTAFRKSQIAIKYAQKLKSPETSLFWWYASNATRFEQRCRTIAATAWHFDEEMDLGTDIGNPADKVLHLDDYMWNCV
jgi:hypothetical protein